MLIKPPEGTYNAADIYGCSRVDELARLPMFLLIYANLFGFETVAFLSPSNSTVIFDCITSAAAAAASGALETELVMEVEA